MRGGDIVKICLASFWKRLDLIGRRIAKIYFASLFEIFFFNLHLEAKLNFATHSFLSVKITDPKTLETTIGNMMDTFRNTTSAVNQMFF